MGSPRLTALKGGSRRARVAAACAAVGAVPLAIGIIVGAGPDSSQGASPATKVSGAATVQRRDLVATDTESGTLNYASPQTVFNRMSGTITWLPQVGQVIKPGHALYYVDNQPIVLFNGATPAYRDLSSSASNGPDILELNRGLVDMGFDPNHEITVDNSWQTGTTDAVDRWQNSLGETETGTITLGEVVFLPGVQRITSVDTVLGSTGGRGPRVGLGHRFRRVGFGHRFRDWREHDLRAPCRICQPDDDEGRAGGRERGGRGQGRGAEGRLGRRLRRSRRRAPEGAQARAPAAARFVAPLDVQTNDRQAGRGPRARHDERRRRAGRHAVKPRSGSRGESRGANTGRNHGHDPVTDPPTSSGSGRSISEDATINRALKALLKAETLLLQKSLASSGKGSAATGGSASRGRGGQRPLGERERERWRWCERERRRVGWRLGRRRERGEWRCERLERLGLRGQRAGDPRHDLERAQRGRRPDATKQSEAVVGEPVTVQMPDGSTVDGKITQVSPVAQSSSSSSGSGSGSGGSGSGGSGSSGTPSATIPVTIGLQGRIPSSGLDQAAVSVNFQQQKASNVLSVPVTALLATQGGGYALQDAVAPHKLIPVTPGLFAAGYVQISSSQIYPGLQVTDSQG